MEVEAFLAQFRISPNKEQKEAICHTYGPALVLAGPGSGKTTVITARCAYLVHQMTQGQIPKAGILTVAFNRAAAKEMAQRYERVYQNSTPAGKQVDFSTFHAFCNGIISRYEKRSGISFTRMEEANREQILVALYEKHNDIFLQPAERKKLANEISRMKNGLVASGTNLSTSNFKNIQAVYDAYEAYKKAQHYIDFDDMLFEARTILQQNPAILQEIQRKYGFFQVDEGQDLSQVQMEILTMLGTDVFLVGDDDQGIYGFRGAKPESIVYLERYFSNCITYSLKQNYRSTEQIVGASDALIRKNEVRLGKTFFTENGKGKRPKCKAFLNDRDWMDFLYANISRKTAGTCGILYRNGASAVLPMLLCYKQEIPFAVSGGIGNFFASFVTKEMLALFAFETEQKRIFERKPEKVLREYLQNGYLKQLRSRCEKMSLRYGDMLRYVSAWTYLVAGLQRCGQVQLLFEQFQLAVEAACASKHTEKVNLSTVHSAKGLEYDTVFVIDLYAGEFPKHCGEEELREERRLFYVAMTRAKKQLYMLYPAKRFDLQLEPGLFWQEAKKAHR